ncbi:MFS transporter [uncultured Desulfosarcina sp.]|uniref:MFS transporter n=1 Tax=uncultured Desulfosarcina sp. TaxID=218289 RepID=UPI0029C9548D|nr:MFS transporter [uncultured Desulfosarcina sp.]
MVNTLGAFGALFTATFIFLTGNGLLNTLLSTRMAAEGYSTSTTGMVLSCYFTGLLTGSFVSHRLIQRVGHIRAFTVFAATTTAAALLHGLYLSPWFWGVLRFLCGVTTFGLFMVIESWLNECTESRYRGRVFSIYMTLTYLGIGIGQQLLNVGGVQGQTLFIIAGIIFALCLVPVSATEGAHPSLPETKPYPFISIFRRSPLGMLGCMAAGLTNSAFYAMTPVVCTGIGLSLRQLSWIMSITVFSGLAAQWTVGTLSDRFDRTVVISVIATAIAAVSGFMFVIGKTSFGGMAVGMGLFGTLMFAVYPVSVARAHDIFGGKDAVAVSAGLLFAYSIGACASPILASGVMTLLDTPFGLFAFWCLINGTFAVITLYLRKREKVETVAVEDQVAFAPMKSTSPVVMSLDPRNNPEIDSQRPR